MLISSFCTLPMIEAKSDCERFKPIRASAATVLVSSAAIGDSARDSSAGKSLGIFLRLARICARGVRRMLHGGWDNLLQKVSGANIGAQQQRAR